MQKLKMIWHTVQTENWLKLGEMLVIAFVGGWLAHLVDFPAAWLTGSLIAVAAASFAGRDLTMPNWLRDVAFVQIGLILGSGFSPDTLDAIAAWPLSILFLTINVFAMSWAGYVVQRRIGGWDHATSLFASMPGALGYVMAIAEDAKADMARVSIAQSIRLFVLLAVLPLMLTPFAGQEVVVEGAMQAEAVPSELETLGLVSMGLLLVVVLLLAPIAKALKIPAGLLLVGMLSSGGLYLSGTLSNPFPDWFSILGFISIGALIGARFGSITVHSLMELARISLLSLAATALMAAVMTYICATVLGFPFAQVFLAFAPGGFEAMVLLAFLFDLNPAYVAGHHLVRYVGLVLLAPAVTSWLTRPKQEQV